MNRRGRPRIGTSGWHYPHWRGSFYAPDLPEKQFLARYVESFDTVEINHSFYRLPDEGNLKRWYETVQDGFVFAVKGSRFITHRKKLKDPKSSTELFLERILLLKEKLGPVLFQLPPRWKLNGDRFDSFLDVLPKDFRYAFEFRDKSWFNDRVYGALERSRAALCVYDLDGFLSPRRITCDFVYVRLHGPNGAYRGQYNTQTLEEWADVFSIWSSHGIEIYCYFDNDERGYAAEDAGRLRKMLQDA